MTGTAILLICDARDGMIYELTCPAIIGPHGKLGFLEGGALEEEIYRRTDRAGIGGSGSWDGGSGRMPQAQCLGAVVLPLEDEVRRHGRF